MCSIATFGELGIKLAEPFHPDEIDWKPQSVTKDKKRCLAAAYIDARAVEDRLDSAVGPGMWKDEYRMLPNGCVECKLSIKIGEEWVAKTDVGTQGDNAKDTDGFGTMTAYSHAFKRAAVKWGIGRYLYYFPGEWVDYDEQKKKIVKFPMVPWWACPGGAGRPPVSRIENKQPRDGQAAADAPPGHQQAKPRQTDGRERGPDAAAPGAFIGDKPEPDYKDKPAQGDPPAKQKDAEPAAGKQSPAKRKPAELPKNGAELEERISKCEAVLVNTGRCNAGELVEHIAKIYREAGVAKPMKDWTPSMIKVCSEHVEKFCKARPPKKES